MPTFWDLPVQFSVSHIVQWNEEPPDRPTEEEALDSPPKFKHAPFVPPLSVKVASS
jgi:hypothetical protein